MAARFKENLTVKPIRLLTFILASTKLFVELSKIIAEIPWLKKKFDPSL